LDNEKIVSDDEVIVLLNDVEVITDDNDPQKVIVVKKDPKCNTTSVGDHLEGSGSTIIIKQPEIDQNKKERSILKFLSKEE